MDENEKQKRSEDPLEDSEFMDLLDED